MKHDSTDFTVELSLLGRMHGLVLLEAGERVVGPTAGGLAAHVHKLAGIVDLLTGVYIFHFAPQKKEGNVEH